MRITFVLPDLTLSGGIRVLAIYADRLRRRGHQVVVVSTMGRKPNWKRRLKNKFMTRKPEREVSYFDGLDVDHRRLPHPDSVTNADVPDADVVVATWWATAPGVFALLPSKGKKAYFVQHYEAELVPHMADEIDATWRLPMRKITVADWLVDLARDRFGDDTAVCVPNSVDPALFFGPPRGKRPRPTFGFMYCSNHSKGSDIALEALARARQKLPSLRAICFGTESPGVPFPPWVEFTCRPPQETLRDLYARCDGFLQASRSEGFGLPILEAMACRTPVIATPTGAAPMVLQTGGGRLAPHENADAMADAVIEIAHLSDAAWRSMSDTAYAVATSYTWDDATEAFEAALESIAHEEPAVRFMPRARRTASA
jgi:glycosyltransferase involved in cell wall biosynthesis